MQLDASFRTFRNLPRLERWRAVEYLKLNLIKMLLNPVYRQNKIKMYFTIRNPNLDFCDNDILPTFLKANRLHIVSLEFEFTFLVGGVKLFWDPYLIFFPNLEELNLSVDRYESSQELVSWMLKKHHQSLQKLHISGVIFILNICKDLHKFCI